MKRQNKDNSESLFESGQIALIPNPILAEKPIKRVKTEDLKHPAVYRDQEDTSRAEYLKLFRKETAADFIGKISPGFHRFGFTKGQFSLIDVIAEVIKQIGRSHLALSTWTVARADLTELQEILSADNFSSIRFLLDVSFQRRQPALIKHIRQTFGAEAVRITRNHVKFMLFGNGKYSIVCRTSMNLNFNPRFEDIELKDDSKLYDFINEIVAELFNKHDAKAQIKKSAGQITQEFNS